MSKIVYFTFKFLYLLLFLYTCDGDKPCKKRRIIFDRIVCVCNAEYCDEISKIEILKSGKYVHYTSNRAGKRFEKTTGLMHFTENHDSKFLTVLEINRNRTFQKIIGFGGAFTDSFGIVAQNLSESTRKKLLSSYFSENGLEYNMARVPMGSADFSDRFYVYNMMPENDVNLSNFSLDENDYKYKISMMKNASEMATNEIYFMTGAWAAPQWMVELKILRTMRREYFQTWADYHLKFLEQYKKNGISFWAMSPGNQPFFSPLALDGATGTGWLPKEQATWLVENLGPTLKNSEFRDIKILGADEQRQYVEYWIRLMETVEGAADYMDGIATHWYTDRYVPIEKIDDYHETHPNDIIISNEAAIANTARDPWDWKPVELGDWRRGELYIINIMECLNHWFMGWIEWNLALNEGGGPSLTINHIDASIIVMTGKDEFVKQPSFYAIGHFSKFIPRNSRRILIEANKSKIQHVAFLREDGGVAVVLYNPTNHKERIIIKETGKGFIDLTLTPKSINSLIYW